MLRLLVSSVTAGFAHDILVSGAAVPASGGSIDEVCSAAEHTSGACGRQAVVPEAAEQQEEEDQAVLMQRMVTQRHNFPLPQMPDIGNIVDKATSIATNSGKDFPNIGKIVDSAKGAAKGFVDDIAGEALVSLGGRINKTIVYLQHKVDKYAEHVNHTSHELSIGVSSLLATSLNTSVPGLKVSDDAEKHVKKMLHKAVEKLEQIVKSVRGTKYVLKYVPGTFQDLVVSFNASLQSLLDKSDNMTISLKEVEALVLGKFSDGTALTQTSKESPSVIISKLTTALQQSQSSIEDFSESFGSTYDSLSDSVEKLAKSKLSHGMAQNISQTFHEVAGGAHGFADKIVGTYGSLLSSVSDGAKAVAPNVKSAGMRSSPGLVFILQLSLLASASAVLFS